MPPTSAVPCHQERPGRVLSDEPSGLRWTPLWPWTWIPAHTHTASHRHWGLFHVLSASQSQQLRHLGPESGQESSQGHSPAGLEPGPGRVGGVGVCHLPFTCHSFARHSLPILRWVWGTGLRLQGDVVAPPDDTTVTPAWVRQALT